MAACVQVPVHLPKDGEPDKSQVKEIVGTFLEEWSMIDPETLIIRYEPGEINAHCFVQRPIQSTTEFGAEPSKVFIKFHKEENPGVEAFKHLVPTKDAEAELVYRVGLTGYGPRMIGFFQTEDGVRGRIDELIDSRTLEPEDVEDEKIRADISKAFAVLHARKELGLTKNPVGQYCEAVAIGLKKYYKSEKIKRLAKEGGVNIDDLVDYEFIPKLARVADCLQEIGSKEGWCIHDVQFGNVLVKNKPREGESKIVLIDFEFVFRNYRGVDIGGHWFQKMFKWTDEVSKIVDCRPYTEEEKKHFCHIYAEKWNEVTGDSDTGEQVFAEASLGYLLALAFDIHFMLMAMDEDDNNDALDAMGLKKLFREFVDYYAQLGFEADG